ncbi:hypothetical protein CPS_0453 [Colwellia psychrerythraea 34H]|uniref:Uncharacterized protein n=1 Tax=Colwellia psychrerythraea (strain 34H / ATCC BAA-681) TaxID=167879 RepID=Q489Q3_COLP3|nr:hypothetical protein CPS_0453 [Colwellia psychrerythraea 34H]
MQLSAMLCFFSFVDRGACLTQIFQIQSGNKKGTY